MKTMRLIILTAILVVARAQTDATCLAGTGAGAAAESDGNCTARGITDQATCETESNDEVCAYTAANCDTGNTCTTSTATDGVCSVPANEVDSTACDDGNANTDTDVCTSGTCAGTPIACDAKANMTFSGDKDAGCVYTCVADSTANGDIQVDGTCDADACDALTNGTFSGDKIAGCVYTCVADSTANGDIQVDGTCDADSCDALTNGTFSGDKIAGCVYTCVADSTANGDIQVDGTCDADACALANATFSGDKIAGCVYTCVADSTANGDIQVDGTCDADACDARADATFTGDKIAACVYTCDASFVEHTNGLTCEAECAAKANMTVSGNQTEGCVYSCAADSTANGDIQVDGTCDADACDARADSTFTGDKIAGCVYTCDATFVEHTDGNSCEAECAARADATVVGNQTEANCVYTCDATFVEHTNGTSCEAECAAKANMTVAGNQTEGCVYSCVADSTANGDIQVDGTCDADSCDARADATFTGDKIAANCVYTCDATFVEHTNGTSCEAECAAMANMTVAGNQTEGCVYSCVADSTANGDIQVDGTCDADACDARADATFTGDKIDGCVYTCDNGFAEDNNGDCVSQSAGPLTCDDVDGNGTAFSNANCGADHTVKSDLSGTCAGDPCVHTDCCDQDPFFLAYATDRSCSNWYDTIMSCTGCVNATNADECGEVCLEIGDSCWGFEWHPTNGCIAWSGRCDIEDEVVGAVQYRVYDPTWDPTFSAIATDKACADHTATKIPNLTVDAVTNEELCAEHCIENSDCWGYEFSVDNGCHMRYAACDASVDEVGTTQYQKMRNLKPYWFEQYGTDITCSNWDQVMIPADTSSIGAKPTPGVGEACANACLSIHAGRDAHGYNCDGYEIANEGCFLWTGECDRLIAHPGADQFRRIDPNEPQGFVLAFDYVNGKVGIDVSCNNWDQLILPCNGCAKDTTSIQAQCMDSNLEASAPCTDHLNLTDCKHDTTNGCRWYKGGLQECAQKCRKTPTCVAFETTHAGCYLWNGTCDLNYSSEGTINYVLTGIPNIICSDVDDCSESICSNANDHQCAPGACNDGFWDDEFGVCQSCTPIADCSAGALTCSDGIVSKCSQCDTLDNGCEVTMCPLGYNRSNDGLRCDSIACPANSTGVGSCECIWGYVFQPVVGNSAAAQSIEWGARSCVNVDIVNGNTPSGDSEWVGLCVQITPPAESCEQGQYMYEGSCYWCDANIPGDTREEREYFLSLYGFAGWLPWAPEGAGSFCELNCGEHWDEVDNNLMCLGHLCLDPLEDDGACAQGNLCEHPSPAAPASGTFSEDCRHSKSPLHQDCYIVCDTPGWIMAEYRIAGIGVYCTSNQIVDGALPTCVENFCLPHEYVSSNNCETCPDARKSIGGSATGADTTCDILVSCTGSCAMKFDVTIPDDVTSSVRGNCAQGYDGFASYDYVDESWSGCSPWSFPLSTCRAIYDSQLTTTDQDWMQCGVQGGSCVDAEDVQACDALAQSRVDDCDKFSDADVASVTAVNQLSYNYLAMIAAEAASIDNYDAPARFAAFATLSEWGFTAADLIAFDSLYDFAKDGHGAQGMRYNADGTPNPAADASSLWFRDLVALLTSVDDATIDTVAALGNAAFDADDLAALTAVRFELSEEEVFDAPVEDVVDDVVDDQQDDEEDEEEEVVTSNATAYTLTVVFALTVSLLSL